jgi:hypothetical protein
MEEKKELYQGVLLQLKPELVDSWIPKKLVFEDLFRIYKKIAVKTN